jgi:hypothetical protein
MKRVVGVFLLYFVVNILYLIMVGNTWIDYLTWNQITNMFVLIVHLFAIFLTIYVTKDEFEDVNKRFMVRIGSGLLYLIIMYIMMSTQYLMLK